MTDLHTTTRLATQPRPAIVAFAAEPRFKQAARIKQADQIETVPDAERVPWHRTALCRVGIHKGQWEFMVERLCDQLRTCERCVTAHVRTKHQREWRYVADRTCAQIKTCCRCDGRSGNRTRHQWGVTYSIDRRTDAHECNRCGEVSTWSTVESGGYGG
jgi:hypothetical protein